MVELDDRLGAAIHPSMRSRLSLSLSPMSKPTEKKDNNFNNYDPQI